MKNRNLKRRQIIGIAYLCVALASTVYATDVSSDQMSGCANCDENNPQSGTNPDGTPWVAHSQDDCCQDSCMAANPDSTDGANTCISDCENYGS